VRCALLGLLLAAASLAASAAEREPVTVTVADPYIELHTGPGRGYPVTHVVARDEEVRILKRRTDWFKVRDERGREGWVHVSQMTATLTPAGTPLPIDDPGREQFGEHRRELGLLAGNFEGANVISAYGAYALNPHLAVELRISQVLGSFSDGLLGGIALTHVFRPDWRVQPLVTMGTGALRIRPRATLVDTPERTDQTAWVGVGFKAYLSRRFILRAQYDKYVVFTDRDENEEADEWKLGFGFFF